MAPKQSRPSEAGADLALRQQLVEMKRVSLEKVGCIRMTPEKLPSLVDAAAILTGKAPSNVARDSLVPMNLTTRCLGGDLSLIPEVECMNRVQAFLRENAPEHPLRAFGEAVDHGRFRGSVSQEFERAEMEMTLSHKRRMLDLEYDTAQKKARAEVCKSEAETQMVQSEALYYGEARRAKTEVPPLVLSLVLDFLGGWDLSRLIPCSRAAFEMLDLFQGWKEIPYDLTQYTGNKRAWNNATLRMIRKSIHARRAVALRVPRRTRCIPSTQDLLRVFLPGLETLDLTSCSWRTLTDVFFFMTDEAGCAPRLHTILPPGKARKAEAASHGWCSRRVSMFCNPVLSSQVQTSWPPHDEKCVCIRVSLVHWLRDGANKIGI